MLKSHIEREGKYRAVMAEQAALRKCTECRHIIHLERTFQDEEYLFFVLEYAAGGDLLRATGRLSRPEGGMSPEAAAFYAAEVWLGLEFLHSQGLAHRDLKPENVLLDGAGRARLADFGAVLDTQSEAHSSSSKPLLSSRGDRARDDELDDNKPATTSRYRTQLSERHGSFEGTAEYVSPEVLQGEPTTTACDLWALGCLVYQLSTGRLPFRALTDFLLWEKIIAFAEGRDDSALEVSTSLPADAEALTRALLKKEGAERLGALGQGCELEGHAFFRNIDWAAHRQGVVKPPYVPVPQAHIPDDKFADFSIEYMLELDLRDDDAPEETMLVADADERHVGFLVDDNDLLSMPRHRFSRDLPISPVPADGAAPRRRRHSQPATLGGGKSGSGSKQQRPTFWGSGAHSMRQLGTPPPSPPSTSSLRARSPPRLQPSTVATSATRAAVDGFDFGSMLEADERLLWRGVVWKRKGLLWRERVFVLTSRPRFVYFDAHCSPPEYKGQVAWTYSQPVHCRRRSQHHFDVVTDDRDYHLASFDVGADVWIRRIDATLNMQATRRIVGKASTAGNEDPPKPHTTDGESMLPYEDDVISDLITESPDSSQSRMPLRKDQVSISTLLLDEMPVVEGWLWKMGKQAAFTGFKKRYAILRGIQLSYYREPPQRVVRSPIGVIRCCAVRSAPSIREDRFAFDIDAVGGRTFHCFVDSKVHKDMWLSAISQVLDARDDHKLIVSQQTQV